MNQLINIKSQEGKMTVSSREIAEHFEKEHKNVLQAIQNLVAENIAAKPMFAENNYENRGKEYPEYQITRDGFSLLVMGFTGTKSLEWKLKYIDAFNQMEREWNSPEKIMARALRLADETINNLQLANAQQDQIISELQPKASYYDLILQCKELLSASQIAKDYGKSAKWLNKTLNELGVQYKRSETWLLYQKYAEKGYTQSKTHPFTRSNGTIDSAMLTYWNQKGRLFIYDILKANGMLPVMEREAI